jgi:hypothetical protein
MGIRIGSEEASPTVERGCESGTTGKEAGYRVRGAAPGCKTTPKELTCIYLTRTFKGVYDLAEMADGALGPRT